MRRVIRNRAAGTAITTGLIMLAMTPFVGQYWPIMLTLWVGWAVVTPLSIRTALRHG